MLARVLDEVVTLRERSLAVLALVRLLSSVDPGVTLQMVLAGEPNTR